MSESPADRHLRTFLRSWYPVIRRANRPWDPTRWQRLYAVARQARQRAAELTDEAMDSGLLGNPYLPGTVETIELLELAFCLVCAPLPDDWLPFLSGDILPIDLVRPDWRRTWVPLLG